MSVSAAQQTANTANARLSTGPRTPQGKASSAQNARRHGLTAKDLVIGPEDREEFNELLAGFQADVSPQGALQQALFDELVASAWNLRRIRRMETDLCSGAVTYLDLINDDAVQARLDRLARHKSRIERTFHRNLKELKALQTAAVMRFLVPCQTAEFLPPLAATKQIAKRTQSQAASPGAIELVWFDPAEETEKELTATAQAMA